MHAEREEQRYDQGAQRNPFCFAFAINRRVDRERDTDNADEDRHFPQITAAPVPRDFAEKIRGNQGEKILGGKSKHRRKLERQRNTADRFARRLYRREQLRGRKQSAARVNGQQTRRDPPIPRSDEPKCRIEAGDDCCVKKILWKSGQRLHRDGKHSEQTPTEHSPAQERIDRAEDQRRPGHRVEVRQMAGKNVQKKCAAKHCERARKKTRRRLQAALFHPEKHECAHQKDMQRNAPIDCYRERQNKKNPIRRIE